MSRSKRMKHNDSLVDSTKLYRLEDSLKIIKQFKTAKFDESVNIAIRMGTDPKKSDQLVRGTVSLPHGTGKKIRLAVVAKGEKAKEALATGVENVGAEDLIEKIRLGWLEFDVLITTPDMMKEVGKLAKQLGPRGLMPTPKAGTVTQDVVKAINELKAGKIEFKVDKTGNINSSIGKHSFDSSKLSENLKALLDAIYKAKPAAAKGTYIRYLYLSTTMCPGMKIDLSTIGATA
jgi:large subunit ribosomal protein L1